MSNYDEPLERLDAYLDGMTRKWKGHDYLIDDKSGLRLSHLQLIAKEFDPAADDHEKEFPESGPAICSDCGVTWPCSTARKLGL